MGGTDRDWHPEDIKAAVRKRGHTFASLAAAVGVTRQALAITTVKPSSRNEKVIARAIGEAPSIIWPTRYDKNGKRKRPQPSENYRRSWRIGKRGAGK